MEKEKKEPPQWIIYLILIYATVVCIRLAINEMVLIGYVYFASSVAITYFIVREGWQNMSDNKGYVIIYSIIILSFFIIGLLLWIAY